MWGHPTPRQGGFAPWTPKSPWARTLAGSRGEASLAGCDVPTFSHSPKRFGIMPQGSGGDALLLHRRFYLQNLQPDFSLDLILRRLQTKDNIDILDAAERLHISSATRICASLPRLTIGRTQAQL